MPFLNSSAIARAEYDARTKTMQLWFRGGTHAYDFYNVPEVVYRGLLQASSAGSYYDQHIKGRYN